MTYHLDASIAILTRTPAVVRAMLDGLDEGFIRGTEGPETWSPFDIVGHLIHGEKTDWIPRARIILHGEGDRRFEPFDRFAQFEASRGRTLDELLDEFEALRGDNVTALRELDIQPADLERTGIHPALGEVTLRQLLATWTVHDLNHIHQIARVMGKQLGGEVGPWRAYLGLFRDQGGSLGTGT